VETGELKTLVIQTLRTLQEASVNEIQAEIDTATGRSYAMSTIATILSRLEEEGIIIGEKKRKIDRKKTYYSIKPSAHKEKATEFLRDYITQYGDVGIRHLSDVMGNEISQDELVQLRAKLLED
jgi:DNA-binding PadR family transcriptional regulator